jgi:hypothetical protein
MKTLSTVEYTLGIQQAVGHLTVSSDLHHYVQKQAQLLSLLSVSKCIVLLQFLNKGSAVTFF